MHNDTESGSDSSRKVNLSSIDQKFSKEQEKIISDINYANKEIIDKIAKELNGDIKNIGKKIQAILTKHHNDYVSTFTLFMNTVRKDIKLKLEKIEKNQLEKQKIFDLKKIQCERDYFRLEAFKLNKENVEFKKKILDTTRKLEIVIEEVNAITLKLKEAEKVNRQLLSELEEKINSNNELKNELSKIKEEVHDSVNKNNLLKNISENSIIEGYEAMKENQMKIIEALKSNLEKEQHRSQKLAYEINRMRYEKNNLENVFIDCVEEARKSVFNRRIKEKAKLGVIKIKTGSSPEEIAKHFLPSDKTKILENFLFNEEVTKTIRNALLPGSKEEELNLFKKKLAKSSSLPELKNLKSGDGAANSRGVLNSVIEKFVRYGKTLSLKSFPNKNSFNFSKSFK